MKRSPRTPNKHVSASPVLFERLHAKARELGISIPRLIDRIFRRRPLTALDVEKARQNQAAVRAARIIAVRAAVRKQHRGKRGHYEREDA